MPGAYAFYLLNETNEIGGTELNLYWLAKEFAKDNYFSSPQKKRFVITKAYKKKDLCLLSFFFNFRPHKSTSCRRRKYRYLRNNSHTFFIIGG